MKRKTETSCAKKSQITGFSFNQCYAFLRGVAIILVILALFIFTIKAFSHLHLEIDVPEHVWEQIEREDRKMADERVINDPENASKSDWDKSYQHREDNTA